MAKDEWDDAYKEGIQSCIEIIEARTENAVIGYTARWYCEQERKQIVELLKGLL